MGFFDFVTAPFKAIGHGLNKVVKTVGKGLSTVYNKVLKPAVNFVGNKVLKPVYKKVIKPVFDKGMKVLDKGIDTGMKMADLGVKTATGFSKILTNPIKLIGGWDIGNCRSHQDKVKILFLFLDWK